MSRREAIAGIALTGYWLVTVLAHLQVSLWLVRRRQADWLGSFRYADFLPWLFALAALGILIWQLVRAIRAEQRLATAIAWLLWFALAWAFDRWLTYSLAEMLHYPQYGLLAYLLALSVDPDKRRFAFGPVLLAVVLLGIADEALQYVWITTSYSNYLDFNDFLLNLLGGVAGLLLHYGFAPTPQSGHSEIDPGPSKRTVRPQPDTNPWIPGQARDDEPAPCTGSRNTPGMATIRSSARHGLLGFAWLGTAMLLAIAVLHVTSTDPERLHAIERQPSYSSWIPGPRAGRYYVLGPVTGTLILVGLGTLASAAPTIRRRNKHL